LLLPQLPLLAISLSNGGPCLVIGQEQENIVSVLHLPATGDILLLYPGESLRDQIRLWRGRRLGRRIETSFEKSLPEIRGLLRHAGAALVDATDDPSQAADALLQAVTRLGANAAAVYSERMHDGLELFVRVRGSMFLLGPLLDDEWDGFFERWPYRPRAAAVSRVTYPGRGVRGVPARFTHRFSDWKWPGR
jgi:hypothetical protein